MIIYLLSAGERQKQRKAIRLRGQAVKTSPFHGGNTGSIPVGVTKRKLTIKYGAIAKW